MFRYLLLCFKHYMAKLNSSQIECFTPMLHMLHMIQLNNVFVNY